MFRYLFGWLVPPPVSLLKLTQTNTTKTLYELHHVVQDILVPVNKMIDTLNMLDKQLRLYPIWICPFKLTSQPGLVHPLGDEDEMYVDIILYGNPQVKPFIAKDCIRNIERFARQVHGFQMLYGDMYMSREEFHEMFDHTCYNEMRKKLNCENAFPEIYDKVCNATQHISPLQIKSIRIMCIKAQYTSFTHEKGITKCRLKCSEERITC